MGAAKAGAGDVEGEKYAAIEGDDDTPDFCSRKALTGERDKDCISA